MIRFLVLSAIVISIVGCATLGMKRGLSDEDRSKFKNIAVYSGLGDKVQHVKIGTTVFQNKMDMAAVADWKIDSYAESAMVDRLKRTGRYNKVGRLKGIAHGSGLTETNSKDAFKNILSAAKEQGYDAVVFLAGSRYDNAPNMMPGYGIQRTSTVWSGNTKAYVLGAVNVYDTSTGESAAWQWTFDAISAKPSIFDDEKLEWHDDFSTYSAREKTKIQKAIKRHLAQVLDYSFGELKLTTR